MPFKVIYFTSQTAERKGGWGNQFWNSLSDRTQCEVAARALVPFLQDVLGLTTLLTNIRVSASPGFRDVNLINLVPTPPASPASYASDYQTSGIQLKCKGANGATNKFWLTGIPDNQINSGGFYLPTGSYVSSIKKFATQLQNAANGWSLRVLDPAVPFQDIFAITQAGIVTVANHGYNSGDVVRISRARGLTQANKVWKIVKIDADTFSLVGWVQPPVAIPYLGNGKARKQVYAFTAIQSMVVVRATSHKRGRPFGLLSGRQKRKRA